MGAKVVIADLQLNQEAQKLVDASGSNTAFKKTDVTNWKDLNEAVKFSKEQFGSTPDVYIAGAGIFEPVSRYRVNGRQRLTFSSHGRVSGMIKKTIDTSTST